MLWLFMHGMDKQFIKDCLEKKTTRTETANNIAMYINDANDKSNFIIRNECKY